MHPFELLTYLPLVLLLIAAAVIDLRERRIPNWLNLCIFVAGVGSALMWASPVSIWMSVLGVLAGFGLMLVKFVIGAAGAGDVKLLAAIGAWVGPLGALQVFVLYQVVGLVVVLVQAIQSGRLPLLLRNSMVLAGNLASMKHMGDSEVAEMGARTRSLDAYMPDAVPILIAVVGLLVWQVV